MDNKIVEKIQKLLSLSESSNEFEAQASMLKAQQLLAQHKLSLKEVTEFKVNNSKIKRKISAVTFARAKWKANLAGIIADNFGCYLYYMTRRSHTIVFFGREEDVEVCNIILEYAIDCINSTVRKIQYRYSKDGYSTKGIENDYALGFVYGLNKKLEEQKRANTEWALVLVKDKEVVEEYDKITFSGKGIYTSSKVVGYRDIVAQGVADGGKFSISDKIAGGDEVTLALAD